MINEEQNSVTNNIQSGNRTPQINMFLKNLTFLESLGEGAFGEVIRAWNKEEGRYYALKFVKITDQNMAYKIKAEIYMM